LSARARSDAGKRCELVADEKEKQNSQLQELISSEWSATPISITRLMSELKNAIDDKTIIVDDCWSSSEMLRKILDLNQHNQFFRSRKGGSIGWGIPGAIGIQLGAPEKKVVAVSGDGSAAWSMQGLWTAARYDLPVTFIVTNNATYRQVKLVRKRVLGDYPLDEKHMGMELDQPVMNFSSLAQSMGVKGIKVADPELIRPALSEALALGKPCLVEVMVENKAS
jgi:benzoylformate decarboxylase